jgi:hypothetical protein
MAVIACDEHQLSEALAPGELLASRGIEVRHRVAHDRGFRSRIRQWKGARVVVRVGRPLME